MVNVPFDRVLVGDCVETLAALPPGFADLVVVDPPYNIGLGYAGYDDRRPAAEYLAWCDRWLAACKRALKPTGSFFLVINDEYAAQLKLKLDALGLHWRNWIVWHYTFGVYAGKKFGRDHAHVLYYTADPKRFTFDADAVRVASARQEKYNDKRANPKGRVPGDVWTFSRVCGTFKERSGHVAQMPVSLLERIVRVASKPGDLVLDPMCGSGSTLVAARRLCRWYLGIELTPAYAKMAEARLAEAGRTN